MVHRVRRRNQRRGQRCGSTQRASARCTAAQGGHQATLGLLLAQHRTGLHELGAKALLLPLVVRGEALPELPLLHQLFAQLLHLVVCVASSGVRFLQLLEHGVHLACAADRHVISQVLDLRVESPDALALLSNLAPELGVLPCQSGLCLPGRLVDCRLVVAQLLAERAFLLELVLCLLEAFHELLQVAAEQVHLRAVGQDAVVVSALVHIAVTGGVLLPVHAVHVLLLTARRPRSALLDLVPRVLHLRHEVDPGLERVEKTHELALTALERCILQSLCEPTQFPMNSGSLRHY
mmetsp:Transcript_63640/g.163810  ORF Transcript_63640/g.163810 Transcript_63640/m.163810 type:complete len:293 (+) Transcript_63640:946-1824(+)